MKPPSSVNLYIQVTWSEFSIGLAFIRALGWRPSEVLSSLNLNIIFLQLLKRAQLFLSVFVLNSLCSFGSCVPECLPTYCVCWVVPFNKFERLFLWDFIIKCTGNWSSRNTLRAVNPIVSSYFWYMYRKTGETKYLPVKPEQTAVLVCLHLLLSLYLTGFFMTHCFISGLSCSPSLEIDVNGIPGSWEKAGLIDGLVSDFSKSIWLFFKEPLMWERSITGFRWMDPE